VTMTAANVYVAYIGPASSCTTAASSAPCNVNEVIPFGARSFGYNFGCATHSFSWNFGDGQSGSGQDAPHAYATAGTYTVTVTISNGTQTIPITQSVRVGGSTPTTCPTMIGGTSVFIDYVGSGCTTTSGECNVAENVNFQTKTFAYNMSCATHTFEWNFGDGGTSTDQNPSHKYAVGGNYKVTLKVSNPTQNVTMERTVKVVGVNNCPTMVANQNVVLLFLGLKSKCNAAGGTCAEDEEIAFGANALGYNFACSPHTFLWAFGDGTTSNDQAPTHVYDKKGTYNGTLAIENSKQKLVIPFTVNVSSGSSRRRSAGR